MFVQHYYEATSLRLSQSNTWQYSNPPSYFFKKKSTTSINLNQIKINLHSSHLGAKSVQNCASIVIWQSLINIRSVDHNLNQFQIVAPQSIIKRWFAIVKSTICICAALDQELDNANVGTLHIECILNEYQKKSTLIFFRKIPLSQEKALDQGRWRHFQSKAGRLPSDHSTKKRCF